MSRRKFNYEFPFIHSIRSLGFGIANITEYAILYKHIYYINSIHFYVRYYQKRERCGMENLEKENLYTEKNTIRFH